MTWRSGIPLLILALLTAFPSPESSGNTAASPDYRGGVVPTGVDALYAWGNGVYRIDLPSKERHQIAPGRFSEGGCVYDIDRDGTLDVVLQSGGPPGDLVWINGRNGKATTIDSGIDMHDCLVTPLLGRTGVLMIQKGMQVRFYSFPSTAGAEWGYREVYSFYTPSYQTSLILSDVDGDGLPDLFCGNYWMKSPERFELPWHIFAINTYSETEKSAMLRLALLDSGKLVVAQGHMKDARVTVFEKPDDPRRPWLGTRLEDGLHLVNPHGLLAIGDSIIVGENNARASRLVYFPAGTDEHFRGRIIPSRPVIALLRWKGAIIELWPDNLNITTGLFEGKNPLLGPNPPGRERRSRWQPFLPAPPPSAARLGRSPGSAQPPQ